ncbi:MAG: tetratricopeptide repeat protein [Xanthobacteraceae bacterium]|nr:tetratricopeptide repeat protein [Xanthobacteraceae bacterium]
MRQPPSMFRWIGPVTAAALLSLTLAGCQTAGLSDITGALGGGAETRAAADPARAAEIAGERYRANPKSAEAAMRYGQALRKTGQRAQAVAVLEQAALVHPADRRLLGLYGKALVDNGDYQKAFDILGRAHSPADPDWRILSVQGAALDQLGRHDEARRYYASALKIVPEEPSVLSNLGMSYVLTKELTQAEQVLRRAYTRPGAGSQVRQNLALVVGLQGRFAEAESIVKADLPPDEAAANAAYLKQMLDRGQPPRVGEAATESRRQS